MSRRRVLILCYFYPPLAGGGVHRVLSFTRYLPEHGWDCTVVCAGEEDYWVKDESLEEKTRPETEVIRVRGGSGMSAWLRLSGGRAGSRSGRAFSPLRKFSDWWLLPDSYAGWAGRASSAAARRLGRGGVDVVLSSSPPDSVHLAALRLQRRFRTRWVADFRDPWIGLEFRRPPTRWHLARQAAMERSVLERADAVVLASSTHRRTLGRSSGAEVDASRVHVIPNGFETVNDEDRDDARSAESIHFRIVFTGTLSLMPDTEVFLEAVHEALKRHPEARRTLRAQLVGPYDAGYADRAVALGLNGIVEFTGPKPHLESRRLQREAALLMLWKPRGAETMVPGKLYEYLDAGTPILALLEPGDEAAGLAARAGAEIIAPGDRDALAAAIESRWLAWRAGTRTRLARPEWLGDYRREVLAGRLAGVLDQVTAART